MTTWKSILLSYLGYENTSESLVDWANLNHLDLDLRMTHHWDILEYVASELRLEYPAMPQNVLWKASLVMACRVSGHLPDWTYRWIGESAEEYLRQMMIPSTEGSECYTE